MKVFSHPKMNGFFFESITAVYDVKISIFDFPHHKKKTTMTVKPREHFHVPVLLIETDNYYNFCKRKDFLVSNRFNNEYFHVYEQSCHIDSLV